MSGRKEPFEPIEPGRVRMYVCGITVYDHIHVGHARSQVAFDVVRRWLDASEFRVTYVRNITDIDDKILARARERGEPYEALTARYIASMNEDFAALGLLAPDHEPRATGYIPEIIAMIGRLVDRGFAYVGADGDVFYSVAGFREYGRLSGKKLEDLRAGARVEVDEAKRDPLDFVLWKQAKPGSPPGIRPGAWAGRAGTSSVPLWRSRSSGLRSTSTAAAWISSSRTTRMRSPRAAPPAMPRLRSCGCTMDSCGGRREDV
jgi:cysteinyl-tRNA synthetase